MSHHVYPVEGDVELRQEVCDRGSQRPDKVSQAAALHGAVVLAAQVVLNAAVVGRVNVTLQPRPLLPVAPASTQSHKTNARMSLKSSCPHVIK